MDNEFQILGELLSVIAQNVVFYRKKIGMTQIFDNEGNITPVTVVEAVLEQLFASVIVTV